jgi:hypothetical protein
LPIEVRSLEGHAVALSFVAAVVAAIAQRRDRQLDEPGDFARVGLHVGAACGDRQPGMNLKIT